jgi:hypothetical protein
MPELKKILFVKTQKQNTAEAEKPIVAYHQGYLFVACLK